MHANNSYMAIRKNMAIIGANSKIGTLLAERMAPTYDLLLMDSSSDELMALTNSIRLQQPATNINSLACCREASWEADVIVVAAAMEQLPAIAEKIKEVTNRKPVIHFSPAGAATTTLQQLLPHANVVVVELEAAASTDRLQKVVRLGGVDKEALKLAGEILARSFAIAL